MGEIKESAEGDLAALCSLMELEFARQAISWSNNALAAVAELRQAAAECAQSDPAVIAVS